MTDDCRTLHSLLNVSIHENPRNIAVLFDGHRHSTLRTYNEIDLLASKIHQLLSVQGVIHEVVGVMLNAQADLPAVLLGMLRADVVFYTIDKDVSSSRIKYMIEKLHIRLVLVDDTLQGGLQSKLVGFVSSSERLQGTSVMCVRIDGIVAEKQPAGLAYVITTSGTTGQPKIVRVPHSCIVPNITHIKSLYDLQSTDRVLLASPLTFDPSIVEIFTTLAGGATLLVVPDATKAQPHRLVDTLVRLGCTIMQITPTLAGTIGESAWRSRLLTRYSRLRVLSLGGERCPSGDILRHWRGDGNQTAFFNLYGITEVSSWATYQPITEDLLRSSSEIPLGEPLAGTELKLSSVGVEPYYSLGCSTAQELSPGGDTVGELLVGGSQRVCHIDNEHQVLPSLSEGQVALPVFRCTGDIVRRTRDGKYYYVGRNDDQVKRHGKRFNLSEVVMVACQCPGIPFRAAVAILDTHSQLLLLFVTIETDYNTPNPSDTLSDWLRTRLTTYMTPDHVLLRDAFPLTHHGKVDKTKLLQEYKDSLHSSITQRSVLGSPSSIMHRGLLTKSEIARIVCTTSKVRGHIQGSAPAPANYIEAGGDSFTAVQVSHQVETLLQLQLPSLLDILLHEPLEHVIDYVYGVYISTTHNDCEEIDNTVTSLKRDSSAMVKSKMRNTQPSDVPTTVLNFSYSIQRCSRVMHHGRIRNDSTFSGKRPKKRRKTNSKYVLDTREGTGTGRDSMRTQNLGGTVPWTSSTLSLTGDTVSSTGDTRSLTGDTRSLTGNTVSLTGVTRSLTGDTRSLTGDTRSLTGDTRSLTGMSSELTRESQLMLAPRWSYDTGKCIDASPLVAINPVSGLEVCYIGSHSGRFAAVAMETGKALWEICLEDRIESSACLSLCANYVIVGCYDGNIYTLDSLTGREVWRFSTRGQVKSSPCMDPSTGLVYCGSHDHFLYALNIYERLVVWRLNLEASCFSSPTVSSNPHIVYTASLSGHLVACNPSDGAILWSRMLLKPVFSSPAVCEELVVCGCVDGKFYCFSHQGDKLWEYTTTGPVFSSPVIWTSPSGSSVIVCGSHDRHWYCLSTRGRLLTRREMSSEVYSSPFIFTLSLESVPSGLLTSDKPGAQEPDQPGALTPDKLGHPCPQTNNQVANPPPVLTRPTPVIIHSADDKGDLEKMDFMTAKSDQLDLMAAQSDQLDLIAVQSDQLDLIAVQSDQLDHINSVHEGLNVCLKHGGPCTKPVRMEIVNNWIQDNLSDNTPVNDPEYKPVLTPDTTPDDVCVSPPDNSPEIPPAIGTDDIPDNPPETTPVIDSENSPKMTPVIGSDNPPETTPVIGSGNSPKTTPVIGPDDIPVCSSENKPDDIPETLCVAVSSTDGQLGVWSLATGTLLASHTFPSQTFSSPVVWGRHLVVGCRDNNLYCLQLSAVSYKMAK